MLLAGHPCATKVRAKSHCMAKHSLKEFEDLLVWPFLKMAMCFLCFASRCSSLSSSPWTSRGGSCIFAASLYSFPFLCQSLRSFFLTLVTIAELPLSPERLCMLTIFYCTSLFRHQLLQQDVEALGKWTENNYLTFNASKSKPMVIFKKETPSCSYFSLNGSRLEIGWNWTVVSSYKDHLLLLLLNMHLDLRSMQSFLWPVY